MSEPGLWTGVNLPAMPLEGHFERVNTPLRKLTPRERNVVISILIVTTVAILALLFVPSHSERPLAPRGCLETYVAGRVGSEPVVGCGAKAEALCARAATFENQRAATVVAACHADGIPIRGVDEVQPLSGGNGA
jgi:type II secretory pathway component PulM